VVGGRGKVTLQLEVCSVPNTFYPELHPRGEEFRQKPNQIPQDLFHLRGFGFIRDGSGVLLPAEE